MKELYQKYKEIINYLIFGILTTLISLIVYYMLSLTILNPNVSVELQIANLFSWIAGVLFAYFTNRAFVFNSKNENKKKKAVLAPFMAPTAGGFDDFSEPDRNFECTLRAN